MAAATPPQAKRPTRPPPGPRPPRTCGGEEQRLGVGQRHGQDAVRVRVRVGPRLGGLARNHVPHNHHAVRCARAQVQASEQAGALADGRAGGTAHGTAPRCASAHRNAATDDHLLSCADAYARASAAHVHQPTRTVPLQRHHQAPLTCAGDEVQPVARHAEAPHAVAVIGQRLLQEEALDAPHLRRTTNHQPPVCVCATPRSRRAVVFWPSRPPHTVAGTQSQRSAFASRCATLAAPHRTASPVKRKKAHLDGVVP